MIKSFFILSILISTATACNSYAQEKSNLDVQEFEKAIGNKEVQVLDVRTMEEFQSGHLKNALLADWTKKDQFIERVAALDKSKPVYTYCLSGGRSGAATQWLKEHGYTTYNMVGGISKWKQEGKPVDAVVKVKQITMAEYQSMIPRDKTVLVDVSADWCPPCKKMKPVVDSLAERNKQRFTLVSVDGGSQDGLTKELSIEAFPTFIIYKNGKETWRKAGIVEAPELMKHL
jgi:rhodanese-related sulfurtransferase